MVVRLRGRAVTSPQDRDLTTNWYSSRENRTKLGSNSVYSSADQTAITRLGHGEIIDDVIGDVIDDVIDDVIHDVIGDVIEKSVKLTYLYMIFTTIEDKRIQQKYKQKSLRVK